MKWMKWHQRFTTPSPPLLCFGIHHYRHSMHIHNAPSGGSCTSRHHKDLVIRFNMLLAGHHVLLKYFAKVMTSTIIHSANLHPVPHQIWTIVGHGGQWAKHTDKFDITQLLGSRKGPGITSRIFQSSTVQGSPWSGWDFVILSRPCISFVHEVWMISFDNKDPIEPTQ